MPSLERAKEMVDVLVSQVDRADRAGANISPLKINISCCLHIHFLCHKFHLVVFSKSN